MHHPCRGLSHQTGTHLWYSHTWTDYKTNTLLFYCLCMHAYRHSHKYQSCTSKKNTQSGFQLIHALCMDTGGDRAALFASVCIMGAVTLVLLLSSHSALPGHTNHGTKRMQLSWKRCGDLNRRRELQGCTVSGRHQRWTFYTFLDTVFNLWLQWSSHGKNINVWQWTHQKRCLKLSSTILWAALHLLRK